MSEQILYIVIVSIVSGIALGIIISYILFRKSEKLKFNNSSHQSFNDFPDIHENTNEKRANLILLANKLKHIHGSSIINRQKELDFHVNSLNRLLSKTGITRIDHIKENKK